MVFTPLRRRYAEFSTESRDEICRRRVIEFRGNQLDAVGGIEQQGAGKRKLNGGHVILQRDTHVLFETPTNVSVRIVGQLNDLVDIFGRDFDRIDLSSQRGQPVGDILLLDARLLLIPKIQQFGNCRDMRSVQLFRTHFIVVENAHFSFEILQLVFGQFKKDRKGFGGQRFVKIGRETVANAFKQLGLDVYVAANVPLFRVKNMLVVWTQ